MALLGGRAAALERTRREGHSERSGGMLADHRSLIEAALEQARPVQRYGYHEIRQRHGHGAAFAREQRAEEPAAREVTVELERAHALGDGPRIAMGRNEERPARCRLRLGGERCARATWKLLLALGAEVERETRRIAATRRTAEETGGRQAPVHRRAHPAIDCRLDPWLIVDSQKRDPEHACSFVARSGRVAPRFRRLCPEMP